MDTTGQGFQTTDEQLDSFAFSFEKGWLAGVLLGTVAIIAALSRRNRRVRGKVDS